MEIKAYDNDNMIPKEYYPITKSVEWSIQSNNPYIAKSHFTDGGYESFELLLNRFGTINLSDTCKYKSYDSDNNLLSCSCPVKVVLENDSIVDKTLVLRINASNRKIESLVFALTQKAEADIFDSATPWSKHSRYKILGFLEDMQTALILKDEKYFKRIISDNAVIMVDSTMEYFIMNGDNEDVSGEKVVNNRRSRAELIKRLKNLFDRGRCTTVYDEDFTVGLISTNGILPRDAAFAIQIRQLYTCSNGHADRGYLTLFLNMGGKSPLIEVLLWQSEGNVMPYYDFIKQFRIE
ncbi:MAG: hypothetical protein K2M94_08315 [Paramuribaculum sp.]|nr:hypothetical protein [Paramuribaculum sp.]